MLRYGATKLKGFACRHLVIAIVSESQEICEMNCLVIKIVQSMSTRRVTTPAPTTTSPSSTKGSSREPPATKRPHKPRRRNCCPKEIMKICLLGKNKKLCRRILKKCACIE
ncbi:unnamed protein product [Cylicocyclus nassatus]|uniref:Uncharacterized protein n=1 Tax=Cylicocyclus nassatus TaxID=53992 RepID=A0AA36GMQ9_CYLNA|nr:unnamed protein product [Cylicocyclus nassatus]